MTQFKAYLQKIGITTKVLLSRVQFVYDLASRICPEEIEEMFVSDYIDNEGTRQYESVWLFSKGYCMEAENFVTDYSIDIVPLRVKRFEFDVKQYDFKKGTEESRLRLTVQLEEGLFAELRAARENCDVLRDITFKYIKPKLAQPCS